MLTHLQQTTIEIIVAKGEIAHNKHSNKQMGCTMRKQTVMHLRAIVDQDLPVHPLDLGLHRLRLTLSVI